MPSQQNPGTMVHYVLPSGQFRGRSVNAMVLDHQSNDSKSISSLVVFDTTPHGGGPPEPLTPYVLINIAYDAGNSPGTWH